MIMVLRVKDRLDPGPSMGRVWQVILGERVKDSRGKRLAPGRPTTDRVILSGARHCEPHMILVLRVKDSWVLGQVSNLPPPQEPTNQS